MYPYDKEKGVKGEIKYMFEFHENRFEAAGWSFTLFKFNSEMSTYSVLGTVLRD